MFVSLADAPSVTFDGTTFDLSGSGDSVRPQDLEQLKTNSVKCLTDTLFKKLLDMEEVREGGKGGWEFTVFSFRLRSGWVQR